MGHPSSVSPTPSVRSDALGCTPGTRDTQKRSVCPPPARRTLGGDEEDWVQSEPVLEVPRSQRGRIRSTEKDVTVDESRPLLSFVPAGVTIVSLRRPVTGFVGEVSHLRSSI